jgi:hypothetical protein
MNITPMAKLVIGNCIYVWLVYFKLHDRYFNSTIKQKGGGDDITFKRFERKKKRRMKAKAK